jgi:uncharacterized membrane protein YphA (DoxX/SURF4 family)
MRSLFRFLSVLGVFLLPALASAHEVYVLTPQEIQEGIATPAFSSLGTIFANADSFALSAFLAVLAVFIIFFAGISRWFEKRLDPLLATLKHYGPALARVTIGLSFIAGALFDAAFGPELPLPAFWGPDAFLIRVILFVIGFLIVVGFYTRLAALVALVLFLINVWAHGTYMLTYTNYFGEILVLLLIGAHKAGIDRFERTSMKKVRHFLDRIAKTLAPYSFLILRVAFGISLFYASIYAKFLHNDLALQVAELPLAGHAFGLAHYFGIEPHFLVLGAGIIEVVIALFFILGIEIRFTALFVEFWVLLSVWWFGEVVWPHIILLGIPLAFVFYGYDKYSLEGWLFKKGNREPVF